jgi:hypothetical protein
MIRELMEDHLILALLMLVALGLVLGFIAIYTIETTVALMHIAEWAFAAEVV